MMPALLCGSLSFVFFFIFDYNKLHKTYRCNFLLNYIGMLLLFLSVFGLFFDSILHRRIYWYTILLLAGAALFFGLLIYSLFLELPFKSTYVDKEANRTAYTLGTYALCRHPGVLWMLLMLLFLSLAADSLMFYISAGVWNLLNIVYVVLQEKLFFKEMFNNYTDYITQTPFLIPSISSIKKCMKTCGKNMR